MARSPSSAARVEPALRRVGSAGNSDIKVTERDRSGPRRTKPAGARATGKSGGRGNGRRDRVVGSGKASRPRRSFFRRTLRAAIIVFVVAFVAAGGAIAYYASKLPAITSWVVPERPPNIEILAADGTTIANRGDTGGANVTLEQLPPYLWQAVVAIEDRRFYSHFGVDPIGLGRVVLDAVTSGDRLTGASTITQQLARTLFLTMDRTAERKIQEAIMAVWLELQYSKDDILEMYLNRVYFGAGAYGIDAAARIYFGKPASRVTLAEAAILAGVLPRPSSYAPTVNPEAAKARQMLVLQAMVDSGYITQREADLAAAGEVVTVDNGATGGGNYVADWVADLVPDFIGAIPGDIVVDTTIDPALQAEAAIALGTGLDEDGEALGVSQGALLAMSPDGAVRALVGGRNYSESQFNRAVNAQRQPGSAFKPFVYLTALEYGLTPNAIRFDQPVDIDGWTPGNYTGEYLGPVSLQQALALSLNTVSAQLTAEVGAEAVVATARRLGIGSQIEPNLSIALGTSEVSLLEMTGAYGTFANGGSGVIPYVIRRILTEDGEVLYERTGAGPGQVVHPQYIAMMNAMMAETLVTGTGRRASIDGWEAAGKTGTSQDWRDAWFVGYTAHLVATVWLGNDDNSPTERATGGNLPATIWHNFMSVAHEEIPVASLPGGYRGGVGAQNITDVINQNGYQNGAPAGYVGPNDQYNPNYDPRYDPTFEGAPAPVSTVPAPVPKDPRAGGLLPQAPLVGDQQQTGPLGGLLRRLFGGN
ncbi:MAG: transglycosylase domain-containing protein [Alphaproteobacteria bacterium]